MEKLWDLVFAFDVPVERVWSAYFELEGADPPDVGTTFTLPDAAGTVIEITDVRTNELLAYRDKQADLSGQVTIAFESTETGSRITVTRFGFGEGIDFDIVTKSQRRGWWESLADLALYLRTGHRLRRHLFDRSATGVVFTETGAGMQVEIVGTDSLGSDAGLEAGDLLLAIDGAAIYSRSDLWLLARLYEAGRAVDLEFARGTELRSAKGRLRPIASAVPGELGLGPRIEGVNV
jgi:uncharacterized protein YndB with AHSA1/START domain